MTFRFARLTTSAAFALFSALACGSPADHLAANCKGTGFVNRNGKCIYGGKTTTVSGIVRDYQSDEFVEDAVVQVVDGDTSAPLPFYDTTGSNGKFSIKGVPALKRIGFLVRAEDAVDTYQLDITLPVGKSWQPLGSFGTLTRKLLAAYVSDSVHSGKVLVLGVVWDSPVRKKEYARANGTVRINGSGVNYFDNDGNPLEKGERDALNVKHANYLSFNVSPGDAKLALFTGPAKITETTVRLFRDTVAVVDLVAPAAATSAN